MPIVFGKSVTNLIGAFGFDSASNVQTYPAVTQPLTGRINWDGNPGCSASGLGASAPIDFTVRGSNEGIAHAFQQSGSCFWPTIDNVIHGPNSTGSIMIDIPSGCDGQGGGYVDMPFDGLGPTHDFVGPSNGGQVYIQYLYRMHDCNQTFNGTAVGNRMKAMIIGPAVPWTNGSAIPSAVIDHDLRSIRGPNIFTGYTHVNFGSLTAPMEPTIGGTLYLQAVGNTGICLYTGTNPISVPPCVTYQQDTWHEVTWAFNFVAAANDFSISGNNLTKTGFWGAVNFTAPMPVNCAVYCYDSDQWSYITSKTNDNTVVLFDTLTAGTNKTFWVANHFHDRIRMWLDGVPLFDIATQPIGSSISGNVVAKGLGQWRLQPQNTSKTAGVAHTPGRVWYDNLIIARDPIPFGAGTDSETTLRLVLR